MIAFIGSVFSPYYALARRRAGAVGADPLDHCAVNVALYGENGARWTMTERGRGALHRDAATLRIGPSALQWTERGLRIDLNEIAAPWPTRVRGRIELQAAALFDTEFSLAPGHAWRPIAPVARVEVDLGAHRWSGAGYLDTNHGDSPLAQGFVRWNWSRTHLADGDCLVFYDLEGHAAPPRRLALRLHPADTRIESIDPLPAHRLAPSRWGIQRLACGDPGSPPVLRRTLTDAPFYARSLVDARCLGEPVQFMHESLSLTRFASPWVQAMLPFRMPRRGGW